MKLNFILIDDSSIELLLHTKHIEREVKDVEVMTFIRAKMALKYLKSMSESANADPSFIPHVILVDLAMPEMNGVEFLDAFAGLNSEKFQKTRVYMLSSDFGVMDVIKKQHNDVAKGLFRKPLTPENIRQMTAEQH